MVDLTKLNFFSGVNYLKRSEFCGSTTLTLPSFPNTITHTVTHNLGYIPFYQVFVKSDTDNVIWTPFKLYEYFETPLTGVDPPYPTLSSWVTTTTLTISLRNSTSPVASGTRDIYWLIYMDYTT